jgi:putative Mn2+ efflux pump MntP
MPKMNLSHFEAAFLFSLFTSVVMGIVTRKTDRERLLYGAYCFGCFLVALFAIGWVMRLGHG